MESERKPSFCIAYVHKIKFIAISSCNRHRRSNRSEEMKIQHNFWRKLTHLQEIRVEQLDISQ